MATVPVTAETQGGQPIAAALRARADAVTAATTRAVREAQRRAAAHRSRLDRALGILASLDRMLPR